MGNRRRKKAMKAKQRKDEMTLGHPPVRFVGQSGFLRNSGGGDCKVCGQPWDQLFPDGTGPCCHKANDDNTIVGRGPAGVQRNK